jgi:hypothetical protein
VAFLKMKYKIEQYERCETTSSGLIEDHLIGITKPSIDRMLRMDNAGDCIALYTFYCYTRKWQKNTIPRATSEYAMEGLKWGRERFSKAKNNLLQLGLIEDVQRIGENGRVLGWYIGVKFAQNATLGTFNVAEIPDNHPTGFPQGGQTRVRENRIQIPITNIKIPNTNKEIQEESSAMASHSSVDLTDLFPTNPSEANASGSANAKLKSADGKEKAPHCAAPPRNKKSSANQIEKPTGVSEQVWNDFIAHRKAKRAPLSQTALTVIAKEAEKASVTLEEALIVCLTRGWQGFNAEWMKKTTGFTKPEKWCNI